MENNTKTIKRVIFLFLPVELNRLERYLADKAKKGWQLIAKRGFIFTFKMTTPKPRQYFSYFGFDASRGFSYDYLSAKEKYEVRKSEINKFTVGIFEVDSEKIDCHYNLTKYLRNKYYFSHYLWLSIITFAASLLSIVFRASAFMGTVIWAMFLYYFVSFIIITCEMLCHRMRW